MRRMQLPWVCGRSVRLLSLTCLLSALAFQSPVALAEGTPGTTPQPKTALDVVREMAPPAPNPQLGGRAARTEAREKANENVRKAEQERQQASNEAARNPNEASQAKDLEAQQKVDQAATDAAKLTDSVREANQAYQDAYKQAETAANNLAADTPDKTLKLAEAKRRYEAALEEEKAKSARVFAPNWNRQRFAEQMERQRQRQATQQGAPGTPQTQPGGTPGTGTGGNIGQTQTPPTAALVPKINVIADVAGGGEGYNVSGSQFGWSGKYEKYDWNLSAKLDFKDKPSDDLPAGGAKVEPVEYVKVCSIYGSGFYYIPGTDTCMKIGGSVRPDRSNGFNFEFQIDNPNQSIIGLRSREIIRLPGIGVEKDTESGSLYGTLRCLRSIDGGCTIPVPPEQASAYGVPDIVANLKVEAAWGSYLVAGGHSNFEYSGSVADITGQSADTPVQVPQGVQANVYDFSVGDQVFRRFGSRCTHSRPLVQFTNILQMNYIRFEYDFGRDTQPAGAISAVRPSEKLPQAQLDLRSPPMPMRGRR